MAISAGSSFGHYEVLSLLGAGGMGEVYRAKDTHLDREVAIKVLPADYASNVDRLRRFEQEARATSALNHPNILTVHDLGLHEGAPYIVAELLEGEELRAALKRGAIELPQALDYAQQIAAGLAAAHAKSIVHRDLKPENLFVTTDGFVKILDFGLAKLRPPEAVPDSEAPTQRKITDPGSVMGTASYMSPEQARGQEVDARSDIFSLGVVLYEMIAGHPPFTGVNALDVIGAILNQEPAPLRQHSPDTPIELQRIVSKALRKDREQRYQHIKDLLIDLKDLKQELEFEAKLKGAQQFVVPPSGGLAQPPEGGTTNAQPAEAATNEVAAARTSSSAEIILGELRQHKIGVFVGLAVLLGCALALAYSLYRFAAPKQNVEQFQNVKFTQITALGNATSASLSPDSKFVAYAQKDGGQFSLWTKAIATGSAVQIVPPGSLQLENIAFSPDGNYVYYTAWGKGMIRLLYQIPVLGGTPKRLLSKISSGITFSPDGKRFAFVRPTGVAKTALVVANADGSGERIVTDAEGMNLVFMTVSWSPDGRTIAVGGEGVIGTNTWQAMVYGVGVETGEIKPLTEPLWQRVNRVVWLGDGSGVFVLARERNAPNNQLWRLSFADGAVQKLTNDLNSYSGDSLSLSADSGTLLTVQAQRSTNLYTVAADAPSRVRQINLRDNRVVSTCGVALMPDGRILYGSAADGAGHIWVANSDGSNPRRLTNGAALDEDPTSSPDGRTIVFSSYRAGTYNLWRMDSDGENLKQLTHGSIDRAASISPDGKWVVYDSILQSGIATWKVSLDGGEPIKLADQMYYPALSLDGKWVAGLMALKGEIKMAIIPFEGGVPPRILDVSLAAASDLHWSLDGRAIVYRTASDEAMNLWRLPIEGGAPKPITTFSSEQIWQFDLSRDGKLFLIARGTTSSDVVLISEVK